ncbi:hypothetical protein [Paucisalibacillus globulus]|uniref:hypothetical protein n=1 Tax=Paucisalibacillus globulus TaxID=351095 RepID=UPI000BB6CD93|nr:hypothetical protein [Paucisalibacillus globulus]
MIDNIKALPSKTLLFIGLALQLIAILFVVVIGFIFKVTITSWIDSIFYLLYFIGLLFILLAYDKRRKNKKG